MKSYVFYQFNCPVCNDSYTEKIERNLFTRTEEHACSDKEIAIYNYNNNCNYYDYIQNLFRFSNDSFEKMLFINKNSFDKTLFNINSLQIPK